MEDIRYYQGFCFEMLPWFYIQFSNLVQLVTDNGTSSHNNDKSCSSPLFGWLNMFNADRVVSKEVVADTEIARDGRKKETIPNAALSPPEWFMH